MKKEKISDTVFYEIFSKISPKGFLDVVFAQIRKSLDKKEIQNDQFKFGAVAFDGKGCGSKKGVAPNDISKNSTYDKEQNSFWYTFCLKVCLISSSAKPLINMEFIPEKKGEATTFKGLFLQTVKQFLSFFDMLQQMQE